MLHKQIVFRLWCLEVDFICLSAQLMELWGSEMMENSAKKMKFQPILCTSRTCSSKMIYSTKGKLHLKSLQMINQQIVRRSGGIFFSDLVDFSVDRAVNTKPVQPCQSGRSTAQFANTASVIVAPWSTNRHQTFTAKSSTAWFKFALSGPALTAVGRSTNSVNVRKHGGHLHCKNRPNLDRNKTF